jgi:Glycosyl transferase family 2
MFIYKMNIYKQKIDRYTHKVGLFCNARNEKNIKEWAAHHLLIGFDIIVIFDHKSDIPLQKIFENFDKRVIIQRVDIDNSDIKKILMNQAPKIANSYNLDWFIYLDADEFLILNRTFKGVKHFLNTYSYGDSVGINWLMFGSNYLVEDQQGLLLESYTRSCRNLDRHVKSFVRPQEVKGSDNPHYYHIRNKSKMIGLGFNILQYPQCFSDITIPFYKSPAYIAHYVFQSEESYKKRKIDIPGDDGRTRSDIGKEIHAHYNDIINMQPQKYVNQIKDFLKFYS